MKLNEKTTIFIPLALSRFWALLPAILIFLASCSTPCIRGDGNIIEDRRALDLFKFIELNASADVYLSQNSEPTMLTVRADGNVIEKLNIGVEGDVLKIDMEGCFINRAPVEIFVNTNRIEGLTIKGSGNIYSETNLLGARLDLKISGSGDMNLESTHQFIRAEIKGSGDIHLSGKTNRLETQIKGSGDLKAANLTAKSANVSISGSGDTFVNATEYLEATIKGSGDIKYSGKPTNKEIKIKGSGSVTEAD
jgi:hypothetical protein